MRFRWDRVGRLALPLSIAGLVMAVLMNELGLSRLWAVPIGLWCAVQVQNGMNARERAHEQNQRQAQVEKSKKS